MPIFMRQAVITIALAGYASIFLSAHSLAQSPAETKADYSPDDIISHFQSSLDLGAKRKLCIGTASECGEVGAPEEPAPFDLRVQFELNSADLTPLAMGKLDNFALALNDRRLARAIFNIDGHTDALGDDNANQSLSERRADSVMRYLVSKGVSPEKLIARGHGEQAPLVPDAYDGLNRRVEASLAGTQ